MKKKQRFIFLFRLLIPIFILFALLISMITKDGNKFSKLIYYTYQSNIIVLIFYTVLSIKMYQDIRGKKNTITSLPKILHFITSFIITVTFFVYLFFIVGYKSGLSGIELFKLKTTSLILHFVVPLMVLYDYFFHIRYSSNKYIYFLYNLIFPLLYLVFVLIRAYFGPVLEFSYLEEASFYPYPFLDIDKLGLKMTIINYIMFLAIFIALSLLITFLDKRLNKEYSTYITKLLKEERKARQEKGWDFSYIQKRTYEPELTWDYIEEVKKYLTPDALLLDMGTGGGEILSQIAHDPKKISVTEGYLPNLKACQRKLSPLGIEVFGFNNVANLPFVDNKFDIIINRHDEYNFKEVGRILKKDGFFISQQVGSFDTADLIPILSKQEKVKPFKFSLASELEKLDEDKWEIISKDELIGEMYFYDTAALVYFATRLPWQFPHFKVKNKEAELEVLNTIIKKQGYISTSFHRFFFVLKRK